MLPHFQGLTEAEVQERKSKGLINRTKREHIKSVPQIVFENSFSVFNLINFAVITFLLVFYFTTNDDRLVLDSLGIVTVTLANTLIAIVQEIRAARALAKMELLKNPFVTVVRDGKKVQIDKYEIVQDDVLFLEKGEQIVVDGKVLYANRLEVDESLVTGESISIAKSAGDELLSGSFCVFGNGYFRAEKVGAESYATRITAQAKRYKFMVSPLQRKINLLFVWSFGITTILVLVEVLRSLILRDFTPDEVRKISTIAISLIPEGLVFFSSITFTIGIFRIAKIGAIIQKINAIDAFPTIQVVCMDKTGTLTQNKIAFATLSLFKGFSEEEVKSYLGAFSALSTEQNATIKALSIFTEPPDIARLDEIPFRSDIKISAIKMRLGGKIRTFILGGFDVLQERLSKHEEEALTLFTEYKLSGYRNLLFGEVSSELSEKLSAEQVDSFEITPIAIVSLKDEARTDAIDVLKLFEKKNIDVKIISGDSGDSVFQTLREIGWNPSPDLMITGNELDKLPAEQLPKVISQKSIFVRTKPEHKLTIVQTLKALKKETAMIGDGVNDLLAIKEASLGIAMEEGSAITKEAADVVLLKNRFSLLPKMFEEGSKIINTVRYVSNLFITKNAVVIVLSILPWFLDVLYPLTPRKAGLMSILGIALPAYFIALMNLNTSPVHDFFKQLRSFVLLSTFMILSQTFAAYFIGRYVFQFPDSFVVEVMTGTLVIGSIINFLCAVYFDDIANQKNYLMFGLGLIMLYAIVATVSPELFITKVITTFYEITPFNASQWGAIALTTIPLTMLFLFFHRSASQQKASV
jgi:cation-transporting ATPase E